MRSFPEILVERAENAATKVPYRFFRGATLVPEELTFHSLWEQAAALTCVMQSRGLANQRALIVCKSQKNFVVALFACLLGGAIAVPTAPPRRGSLSRRLHLIAEDAQPGAIIFDCDELRHAQLIGDGRELIEFDLRSCILEEDKPALARGCVPSIPSDDAIAFLQYTSGSTGEPKGVMISHGNIKHNCAAIQEGMAISSESSFFGALPLFHDMGLVGGIFLPLFCGCIMGYLSPAEFAQYPERWLQIISAFKVTISGGPNFMYELTARTVTPEEANALDLSSWRVAFCGAEPVRAATISRFASRFADVGFRLEAFYPCYGLAESTLFISGGKMGTSPTISIYEDKPIVACGWPRHDMKVEIVDPDTFARLPEQQRGEIWVAGGSVAKGYWRRPELTEAVFRSRIANDDTALSYLRTGDLGYFKDGELFVCGRIKDILLVNGKNYAPQDIEDETERSHPAVRHNGVAAFALDDGVRDQIVIVSELRRDWLRRQSEWPTVISAIRLSISAVYGIAVSDIVLIRPGALPRTSSGKVRRRECRTEYVRGTLDVVDNPIPRRNRLSAA